MNRYRGPTSVGHAKATASTLCQKCLKRDGYECKAASQERPYVSRPSRTQQLLNPKLLPKLTSDVPNDLLRKKGIADEQLAKKEEERGRKREREESRSPHPADRKRSKSASSFSSVSTISTTLSQSPPQRRSLREDKEESFYYSQRSPPPVPTRTMAQKRRRSVSLSSMSYASASSYENDRKSTHESRNRNARRRRGSSSPGERGRRRSRSRSIDRKSNRHDRSRSFQLSRVARRRRSLTPEGPSRGYKSIGGQSDRVMRDISPLLENRRPQPDRRDNDWYDSSYREISSRNVDHAKRSPAPPPAKERSLSPFSKRLALTQAMNMGR